MALMVYLIMFITAFSSATLIPMGSEAVLIYNITQGYNIYILFSVAVVGNTLGSYVNYFLGLKGEEYLLRKKYIKEKTIIKNKKYFDRYGGVSLLFSWVPLLGDGITFVAGMLQYNVTKFFIYVFISKFFRYLVVLLLYLYYENDLMELLG
jgi:membrane protein YqaA with SNARE-associated domain